VEIALFALLCLALGVAIRLLWLARQGHKDGRLDLFTLNKLFTRAKNSQRIEAALVLRLEVVGRAQKHGVADPTLRVDQAVRRVVALEDLEATLAEGHPQRRNVTESATAIVVALREAKEALSLDPLDAAQVEAALARVEKATEAGANALQLGGPSA